MSNAERESQLKALLITLINAAYDCGAFPTDYGDHNVESYAPLEAKCSKAKQAVIDFVKDGDK